MSAQIETETPTTVESTTEVLGVEETPQPRTSGDNKVYRYPNNLDTREQPHSVNFFISEYVPGADPQNIARQNATVNDELGIPSARAGNGITAENSGNVNNQLRFAANFVSALAGLTVARQFDAGGGVRNLIKDTAAATAAAKVSDTIVKDATSVKSAPAKRIRNSISLHIAQSPQAKYSAEYENESIGALLGTLATNNGGGVIGSITEAAANGSGTDLIARGLVDAATLPKELGLGDANFGGLARAASKKVRNPFQEQIFKTMNFRSFAFQYKFAPRNQSELNSVIDIIDLFKFHMHPEKADSGAFFVFPSIFDIEYRFRGTKNAFVNRIATSVLTEMTVDYGSEGVFTTFRGTDGAPSEITLALVFRELSLLTKDKESSKLTNGNGVGY